MPRLSYEFFEQFLPWVARALSLAAVCAAALA